MTCGYPYSLDLFRFLAGSRKLVTMRRMAPVLLFFGASACADAGPPNCEVARAQFLQCSEEHRAAPIEEFIAACYPPTEPVRMRGTWARAWESNEYFDGQMLDRDAAFEGRRQSVYLVVGGTDLEGVDIPGPGPTTGPARAFHIEFIGRQTPCEIMPNYEIVLIDELISYSEVTAED